MTTFTGTVSIKGHDGNYADLSGINFEGKGGIGLDAYCLVLLTDCNFTGWDTAAVAQNVHGLMQWNVRSRIIRLV